MIRRLCLLSLLVLSLLLVACGSAPETESVESEQPAAADSSSEAVADPATATAVPVVEPSATSEPPPTPTLAPTPTEIVEETAPETDESSGQSSAAGDGSGWGASGSGSQTACDNPYLPMRPGATWTYQGTEDTLVWEVMDVQGDMETATAVLAITVGDVSIDYRWECAAGEGMASFDFASLGSAPAGVELTIEQVSIDGQFLLPAEELVPGASWTTNMESAISFVQEAEGTTLEVTGDMTSEQQNTVVNADPVEFQGQSVAGLRIEQVNQITMLLSLMGTAMEQAMTITNNQFLGYGIGIVSQTSITDFGTESMDLVSYSIP